jgi:uncharacterized protein
MKNIRLLFITGFILLNINCKPADKVPGISLENGLLWEISGNGLTSSSYLFGTYHLIGKNFIDSLSTIGKKFNECKAVAGEFVIDPTTLHKINAAWLSSEYPLSKVFRPLEFIQVSKTFKKYTKKELIRFDSVKPEVIEAMLATSMVPHDISLINPPMDEYFQEEGRKKGYKIVGLETEEFQVNLLFNTPIAVQKRHLLFVVQNIDLARKNIDKLHKLYLEHNLNETYKLMVTDKEYSLQEQDQMVKDRDLKWVKEIPGMIKKQPTFIAVGFGHLVGYYGLINQLKLKGYKVSPVKI